MHRRRRTGVRIALAVALTAIPAVDVATQVERPRPLVAALSRLTGMRGVVGGGSG
ncbi:hypothetical protein [Streptomyces sp. NPDC006267]|uniref:hypothetical protein n=1 Tax=unclassified Streptomyces TaxID=2593676 RepID=UPI0033BB6077